MANTHPNGAKWLRKRRNVSRISLAETSDLLSMKLGQRILCIQLEAVEEGNSPLRLDWFYELEAIFDSIENMVQKEVV